VTRITVTRWGAPALSYRLPGAHPDALPIVSAIYQSVIAALKHAGDASVNIEASRRARGYPCITLKIEEIVKPAGRPAGFTIFREFGFIF
jgi:hypothetical protein